MQQGQPVITVLAVLIVFAICLVLTDVYKTRLKNARAIENMRRERGGLL